MNPAAASLAADRHVQHRASGTSARGPARLRLPDRLDETPVDDRELATFERVGQAIDAVVTEWLRGRDRDRLFVTLASADFAPGLSVLVRSLRDFADVPILILTLDDFTIDADADDVAILKVPALLRVDHRFPHGAEYLGVTLSKLWCFALTAPSRVAYLDADCVVLQPVDRLFAGEGFAAVPDLFTNYGKRAFNAGVFAFTPSPDMRARLFRRAPAVSAADGDQGILNDFFADWRQLPQGFNFLRAHALLRAQAQDKALRIVHYTPAKPWRPGPVSPRDPMLAPLDDLWTARLTPGEHVALVSDWRARIATTEANIASWMDAGAELKRRRRERRLQRLLVALLAGQVVQAGLLAWLVLR